MMREWMRLLAGKIPGMGGTMSTHADALTRYKRLRKVGLQLNHRLVETLSKPILDEGGKKLGILKRNVLRLDSEDELAVLMDYCIYDLRRGGKNAVERFLETSPPAPESDEMVLLKAMREARYALVVVESKEPGVGVHVRDLLRDEPLFLQDIGFSQTAPIGMVMASRIMAPDGLCMTTGAALPVGVLPETHRAALVQHVTARFKAADFRHLSTSEASDLSTTLIRTCLEKGAAEHIEYVDPRRIERKPAPALPPTTRRVQPNARCPCGSGRKFKNCCGSRR